MINTDALMDILPDLLAPLLMGDPPADPARARRAAEQAIAQYQAGTPGELVTIGQIVAFGLTAIDNLRLSMPGTVAMAMKLRLRGNANALNRASLNAAAALQSARAAAEPVWAEETQTEPVELPHPAPTPPLKPTLPKCAPPKFAPPQTVPTGTVSSKTAPPSPAGPPVDAPDRRHWAAAMATVADELRARNGGIPPVQRKADELWAEVLGNVAGELCQSGNAPSRPAATKASLFRSTILAENGGLPDGLPACLGTRTPRRRAGR